MRCIKARSTQAVVGLCGNDSTMTRGLGHADSQASIRFSKKSSVAGGPVGAGDLLQAHLAHVGAGEQRGVDVDRVRRRRHQGGVAGAEQHPHQVGEPLLGPDGGDDLGLGVELHAEAPQVEVGEAWRSLGMPLLDE